MGASSVTWVARTVADAALEQARTMADALGLQAISNEPEALIVATAHGAVLESLRGERATPAHLFAGQDTVIGFAVDDLDAAITTLGRSGFPPLGEGRSAPGVRFQHVRGPGGVAYGLIEHTKRVEEGKTVSPLFPPQPLRKKHPPLADSRTTAEIRHDTPPHPLPQRRVTEHLRRCARETRWTQATERQRRKLR